MVPFGPRFDRKTSWSPFAALVLIARAWAALATSAFGLRDLIADIIRNVLSFVPLLEVPSVEWESYLYTNVKKYVISIYLCCSEI